MTFLLELTDSSAKMNDGEKNVMNGVTKVGIGIVTILAVGVTALYIDMQLGFKADKKACPNVQPAEAAAAVIHDVIRPTNQIFAKHHLSAGMVAVDMNGIQIGSSSILVPFRISTEPEKQYFGMPRCSVLSNVEYGNN